MKIWRPKVCWVRWMETLKTEVTDVCNCRMGCMWPSNVMKQKTQVMSSTRRLDWIAGFRSLTGHNMMNCWLWSRYSCNASKSAPLLFQNSVSITLPAEVCARNFVGFGEFGWRLSLLALCLWLEVMGPASIFSHSAPQKLQVLYAVPSGLVWVVLAPI